MKRIKKVEESSALLGKVFDTLKTDSHQDAPSVYAVRNAISNPNLLINGDFQIWQRGEEFTINALVAYTADRWRVKATSIADGDSEVIIHKLQNGLSIQGSNYSHISQFVEGNLLNKTVTFSMKIDALILTMENINILETVTSKVFNNITVSLVYYPDRKATYVSIRINDNIEHVIEWIKLEFGSISTPFVSRLHGEELALCQRYFQRHLDFAVRMCSRDSQTHNYVFYLPVYMRIKPSVTISNDTFIISVNSDAMYNAPISGYIFITTENYIYMKKTTSLEMDSMVNFGRMDIDAEIY